MLLEIVDLKRFHILNYMSEHITMFVIEHFSFLKKILFILREREREKERERNISVWLPLTRLLLGTWPATQACVLTGNRTSNQTNEPHQPELMVFCFFFNPKKEGDKEL